LNQVERFFQTITEPANHRSSPSLRTNGMPRVD
jgi:hypothetical protein